MPNLNSPNPLLRFTNLKARGIVQNRVTLGRWIKGQGFPAGFIIGGNTRVWRESEIEAWLDEREQHGKSEYLAAKEKELRCKEDEAADGEAEEEEEEEVN